MVQGETKTILNPTEKDLEIPRRVHGVSKEELIRLIADEKDRLMGVNIPDPRLTEEEE